MNELTKFFVIWSRGNKTAKTKEAVLNDKNPTSSIEEKFLINTLMDLDQNGEPTKQKISFLKL